jgi:hypothetical protein
VLPRPEAAFCNPIQPQPSLVEQGPGPDKESDLWPAWCESGYNGPHRSAPKVTGPPKRSAYEALLYVSGVGGRTANKATVSSGDGVIRSRRSRAQVPGETEREYRAQ